MSNTFGVRDNLYLNYLYKNVFYNLKSIDRVLFINKLCLPNQ